MTDEETKGCWNMAGTIPWIIPLLNFHMPKDSVPIYLPSVFDPIGGRGNKSEVPKLNKGP